MRLNVLCDADWESKVDKVLFALSDLDYRRFFEKRNYGSSLDGIIIVLICLDSELNLKQRIRQSKKEKELYMDIVLELDEFKQIDQQQRNKIVANKIIAEVPVIIKKYKFPDFDLVAFEADLKKLLKPMLR